MRSQEQMIATWESLFSGALRLFRSAVLQLGELPKDYRVTTVPNNLFPNSFSSLAFRFSSLLNLRAVYLSRAASK